VWNPVVWQGLLEGVKSLADAHPGNATIAAEAVEILHHMLNMLITTKAHKEATLQDSKVRGTSRCSETAACWILMINTFHRRAFAEVGSIKGLKRE
jgi:hypothetical protein